VQEVGAGSVGAVVVAMGDEGGLVLPRLERGCRCFVGLVEGEVAAYGWVSTGAEWIGELGVEIRPPPADAYIWNCVTLPAHQRRGHFGALLLRVTAALRQEGLSRLWIGSLQGAAERAVANAGFGPVLRFGFVDLVGLRWLSVRGVQDADPRTVDQALRSVGAGGAPLRTGLRRAVRRVH
jgi:GNAT superfamily N-acetyltransferase